MDINITDRITLLVFIVLLFKFLKSFLLNAMTKKMFSN